jgi:hypothetical protein
MSTLCVWRNGDPFYKQLAVVEVTISILEVYFAFADRFDLRSREHHSRDILIQQLVLVTCLAVPDVDIVGKAWFHTIDSQIFSSLPKDLRDLFFL